MGFLTNLLPYWHSPISPPPQESAVLIYYMEELGGHYVVATWTSNNEWWFPGSDKKDYEVIAWQELPNKPFMKKVTTNESTI